MDWSDVAKRDPIRLNLGGAEYCHPMPGYEHYVSVDASDPLSEHGVRHDLTTPVPLASGTVDRIHTEDFLEHIEEDAIRSLLVECHRLLKPGGRMRIGVPDYRNPKDRRFLQRGHDPRYPLHLTLTHFELMRRIVEASPFERWQFYHYWDGDTFVTHPIDYSLGMIRRTPENDPKWQRPGAVRVVRTAVRDLFFLVRRGFRVQPWEMAARKGHRLHVTSLTLDLFKAGPEAG